VGWPKRYLGTISLYGCYYFSVNIMPFYNYITIVIDT
jgi:hypothetical protein